jgi:hypothetical protein
MPNQNVGTGGNAPPQINVLTPEQEQIVNEWQTRMTNEHAERQRRADDQKQGWLDKYRGAVQTVPLTWYRRPVLHLWVFRFIVALVASIPLALISYGLLYGLAFLLDGEASLTAAVIIGVVFSLVVPYPVQLYMKDQIYTSIGNDEVGVMEFWGKPLELLGFKPLGAGDWLTLPPFFRIKIYPVSKDSFPITGSDDVSFEIPVQGLGSGNTDASGTTNEPIAPVTDRISMIDFGGRVNIASDISDIRSVIILNSRVGGLNKSGDRISESLIAAMRAYNSSHFGPRTQYEALAFNAFASAMLQASVMEDVCALGIVIETITPKIQLPKTLRDSIEGTNIERIEATKSVLDAQTSAKVRIITQTGNPNPSEADIQRFASDRRNWVDPNLALVAKMVVEKTADPSSIRIIDTGGDTTASLLEKGKELILGGK